MILEKAIFINRAPFERLELDFKEKGVNVLTAINGKGKTTIITYIVDALYEAAKKRYQYEFEGKSGKYYRVSSPLDVINNSLPSIVYLRFNDNGINYDYIDAIKLTLESYNEYISLENPIPFNNLPNYKSIKFWSKNLDSNEVENKFENNVLTYFPSYRFEQPLYLNNPYNIQFDYSKSLLFNGYLPNPIEVISNIQSLTNWMLDLLLDLQIRKYGDKYARDATGNEYQIILPTREDEILKSINTVVSSALSSKHYAGTVRIGIGTRNFSANRISIMNDVDGKHNQICPSIFALSTGELALISIFTEILRQNDNNHPNSLMADITGIVLIDEVDKHLHISLQKEVLPKMFKLFPNVQFIVSSHSPFLNMGLADELPDDNQIIDLDNGGLISSATTNSQYQEVYKMMLGEKQKYADMYKSVKTELDLVKKPIVITEGKTDWKHLKAALEYFKTNGDFNDIDIQVLEYDFDFGDGKLFTLLNQYKTFSNRYKIIGIFDCDESNGKMIHKDGGTKVFGNNVYAMSLPVPKFRTYNQGGISIEFLYQDNDLKKQDINGRRIFVTSEFNENGRLSTDLKIGVKNFHDVKAYVEPSKEKIQAEEVVDIEGKSYALSKEQFALNILNKNFPFDNINFDAFRPVFERLKQVINL